MAETDNAYNNKKASPKISSTAKGRLVEKIVESFYEGEDFKIERNVKMPTLDNTGRIGEIDVLLSKEMAGLLVKIAIECKNEKEPVQIHEMREFKGKLDDVGIPAQYAIIVSASGFSDSSTLFAKQFGIKPLILNEGSSFEEIKQNLVAAIQANIYLMLTLTHIKVQLKNGKTSTNPPFFFCDKEGYPTGDGIPDIAAYGWQTGQISTDLGDMELELDIPEDWLWMPHPGVIEPVETNFYVRARGTVLGFIVIVEGEANRHLLTNAIDKKLERSRFDAQFKIENKMTLEVKTAKSEEELEAILNYPGAVKIVHERIKLPRVQFQFAYWPLSNRVRNKLFETVIAVGTGQSPDLDLSAISFEELEGTKLNAVWEV